MNDCLWGLQWWEIVLGAFVTGLMCGFYVQRSIGICKHELEEIERRKHHGR